MPVLKLNSLHKKYKDLPEAVRFVLHGILLAVLWVIFYSIFRHVGFIDQFYEVGVQGFTHFLTKMTQAFLELLGYETSTYGKIVKIVGTSGVYLDRGCLARNLMGVYIGFIIAYPGSIAKKAWYIPLGLLLINILNVLRLGGMAMTMVCCPEYVDLNHHYIFKIVVFGAIFILWYFWVFKMNKGKTTDKHLDSKNTPETK